jgi:hypothetical protein
MPSTDYKIAKFLLEKRAEELTKEALWAEALKAGAPLVKGLTEWAAKHPWGSLAAQGGAFTGLSMAGSKMWNGLKNLGKRAIDPPLVNKFR